MSVAQKMGEVEVKVGGESTERHVSPTMKEKEEFVTVTRNFHILGLALLRNILYNDHVI